MVTSQLVLVGQTDFDYYLRRLKRYLHLPVRQESVWAMLHFLVLPWLGVREIGT